jgi:glucose/arabinose dehydrogenase
MFRRLISIWAIVWTCLFVPGTNWLHGASLPVGFVEAEIHGYWPEVAGVTFDASGVMYAWERSGKVWIVENDVKLPAPLLDISDEVGAYDDYGLLGFALHPDFRQNGYVYLLYVVDHHHLARFGTAGYDPSADEYQQATIGRLTRYTARASDNFRTVDPASRTVLIGESAGTGFPLLFNTHGVGALLFGADGTLLVSCGDGAALSDAGSDPNSHYAQGLSEGIIRPKENIGAFRAQLVDCLNGKVLRIDPLTGDGLPGNPFFDGARPRSAASRVWALGLRNAFRMALQPGTGSPFPTNGNPGVLVVGDIGYDAWEEVSVITGPGQNFGWPIYEGFSQPEAYVDFDPPNLDAPNPLFGAGGCAGQFFTFRDLLKESSPLPPSWPNPCDTARQIPGSVPRFVHTRPVLDWGHNSGTGPTRAGIFSNNVAAAIELGTPGSPIAGPSFGGNCIIGGVFYEGTNFPAPFRNKYFFADLDRQWIKTMAFDGAAPTGVSHFASDVSSVVSLAIHPVTGAMYYVLFYDGVRKITYVGGNQPPVPAASASRLSGSAPLTVQFTGTGSTDPEGQPLAYSWNFGDGASPSSAANPSHTFNAPPGVPTNFIVALTVTDDALQTATTHLTISLTVSPANDDFALAQPLFGARGSVAGSNVDADREPAEPNHAGHPGGHSVWYRWQANCHGRLRLDPTGSPWPVLLAVYRGDALASLSPTASAVDQPVEFTLIPGAIYQIAVDGRDGATGQFALRWDQTLDPGGGPDLVIVTNSIRPTVITRTFAPGDCQVLDGCTLAGTRQVLSFGVEIFNGGSEDAVIGSPVISPFFEYDACSGSYQFRDHASFRLLDGSGHVVAAGAKSGSCLEDTRRLLPTAGATPRFTCASQGLQAGWSDADSATLPCQYIDVTAVPPGRYALEVRINPLNRLVESNPGNNVAVVPVVIDAPCTAPPANDAFATPAALTGDILTVLGDTRCATRQPGEVDHASNPGGKSVWYRWTAPYSGPVTVSLFGSTFDTLLAVYTGATLASLGSTRVTQNDDFQMGLAQSQVSFSATAGSVYRFAVDGYSEGGAVESGIVMLHVNPARNDAFTNALGLAGIHGGLWGYTPAATREAGEPAHAGNPGGSSLWFRWVAPRSGVVTFDTAGSRFDTLLAVYTGDTVDSLTPVAANVAPAGTGLSRVTFNVAAGTTFWIAVDGRDGTSGLVRLNWSMSGELSVARLPDGNLEITVDGAPGENCTLQASTNLVDWAPVATVLNLSGRVQFTPQPSSMPARFYRVITTRIQP